MNKLILLSSFLGLLGCQPKDQPSDAAARASGRYAVQSYVVNGDTLYSLNGVNKLGVSDLYVIVDRKGPDSVRVGGFSVKDGVSMAFLRDVGVRETNGSFQLSAQVQAPSRYESKIEGNTFYERSVRGGWVVGPLTNLAASPANPDLEGIIISARK